MPEAGPAASRYARLIAALDDDGTLVLTASRRLARELSVAFNENKLTRGLGAWETPSVYFWQDWLEMLFEDTASSASPTPIPSAAVPMLWERSLRARVDEGVIGVAGLARQAASACRRLAEWKVPTIAVQRSARSRDEQAFAAALGDYQRLLDRSGWVDSAGAWSAAIAGLYDGADIANERVIFAGFDRLSPLVDEVISTLANRGIGVERDKSPPAAGAPDLHAYLDEDTELRSAGAWARRIASKQPSARIAIVVSELEQDAARIGHLVREGFAPGWQFGGADWEGSVELSYGRRLIEYPAIATALSVLRWATQGLTSVEVSLLLRTPCISGSDAPTRAVLERRLRRFPDRLWSPAALADALNPEEHPSPADGWIVNVRKIAALKLRASDRLPPSEWATLVDEVLASIGWPGDASLSSAEFQLINRWRQLLNEIATLDDILGKLTLGEFVGRLASMAAEAIYQPERRGGMIAVLGPLEAAGMEFDALWVARSDADRWPAASHPSSLVSRSLQLEYGLPDASPADTLDYSRRVLARLARSSNDVHFSWSKKELDVVRLPSPLLAELEGRENPGTADPGWYGNSLVNTGGVKAVSNDPVPSIEHEESVGGGAGTVQLQRMEPFSAFATGRLGVRELDPFVPGLNPGLRGSLLHAALERLFADCPSQDDVRRWSGDERSQRVQAAVNGALQRMEGRADSVLRRILALERQRMRLLLHDVIAGELDRSPFSIAKIEERLEFRYAGVTLTLRADRIDQLADGSLLIIDYKTGRIRSLMDRAGEAADLQLVVYAAAVGGAIGGLSLMHIGRREITHRAAGASIDIKPMGKEEWQATLERWKAEVLSLIQAISRGDVRVNLRGDAERRWQLNVLCRAAEAKRAD